MMSEQSQPLKQDDFDRALREDIVPSSPLYRAVPERLLPMCVLLDTYASVNGERMRLPPDVMEGVIPMVGRGNRVFHREMTYEEMGDKFTNWKMTNHLGERDFSLPGTIRCDADLSSILRQHDWCVVTDPEGEEGICGSVHFYDDSGEERVLLGYRNCEGDFVVHMDTTDKALTISIVENVLKNIGDSSKRDRSRLE